MRRPSEADLDAHGKFVARTVEWGAPRRNRVLATMGRIALEALALLALVAVALVWYACAIGSPRLLFH